MDGEGPNTMTWVLNLFLPHTDYSDCGGKLPSQTLRVGVRGEERGHGQAAVQGSESGEQDLRLQRPHQSNLQR